VQLAQAAHLQQIASHQRAFTNEAIQMHALRYKLRPR
jgi:hypothetical protein